MTTSPCWSHKVRRITMIIPAEAIGPFRDSFASLSKPLRLDAWVRLLGVYETKGILELPSGEFEVHLGPTLQDEGFSEDLL